MLLLEALETEPAQDLCSHLFHLSCKNSGKALAARRQTLLNRKLRKAAAVLENSCVPDWMLAVDDPEECLHDLSEDGGEAPPY